MGYDLSERWWYGIRFISEMVGFKWDMIYQKDGGMGYDLSVRWWALSGI